MSTARTHDMLASSPGNGRGTTIVMEAIDAPMIGIRRPSMREDANRFVTEILALMTERGHERYDERVTQVEHAVQCALLAVADGAPDTLVAAALLHDIGHLLNADAERDAGHHGVDLRHEASGAALLRGWFPPEVVAPIALHVRAKRYLVSVDREYAARLSPASQRSLSLQGDALGPVERAAFEALPFADAAVRLRRWDDDAKREGLAVPDVATFAPILHRALAASIAIG